MGCGSRSKASPLIASKLAITYSLMRGSEQPWVQKRLHWIHMIQVRNLFSADCNSLHSRFVSNPKRFRAEMAKHNILVGGSVPLQFFDRVVWNDEPLVLYQAERDQEASNPAERRYEVSMEKYLKDVEGYEFTAGTIRFFYAPFVRTGIRHHDQLSTGPRITIVGTKRSPIASVLQITKSTALANCFSWNKAYSMYPLTTFVHRNAFTIPSASESYKEVIEPHVETYERRGWDFHPPRWLDATDDDATNYPLRPIRNVGDRYTWTIPFDTKGIEGTQADPDYVIEHGVFSVSSRPSLHRENHHLQKYNFIARHFTSGVLTYGYTVGSYGWSAWIRKVMMYKTLEELHRLHPTARPDTFDRMVEDPTTIERLIKNFQKPDTWKYCDDEIPKLYEEWKTTMCQPSSW